MQISRLSGKGQIIISKALRDAFNLTAGQELEIEIIPQDVCKNLKAHSIG